MRGQCFRTGGLAAGEFGFGVGEVSQRGFPGLFQAAGDEPVFRIDGLVAALRRGRVVAGGFDLAAPLGQGGVVAVFELLGGGQAGLGCRGGQRVRNTVVTAVSIATPPIRICRVPRPSTSWPVPVQ